MTSIDIDRLLTDVAEAVDEAQGSFARQTERADLLNRFWMLQDNLCRLVQAVSDDRHHTLIQMNGRHPHLPGTILNFVRDVSSSRAYNIAAVARSCRSIAGSLEFIDTMQTEGDEASAMLASSVG